MMYNTDISKMKSLEYVKSMQEVQKTFERKVKELNITKNEKKELLKNIDYKKGSPYKCNKKMQKIISAIDNDENNKKNKVIDIAGKKINIGKNGIKGNLYSSLNSLFGQEKLNLIYDMPVKEGDISKKEYLIDIFQDIEKSHSEQDYIQVYSKIYEMFTKQMQENLKVDQNITYLFTRYRKNIIELQKNAPIGMDNKYLPEFENMLQVYNTKYEEYMKNIDKDVELAIQEDVASGRPYEKAKESNERMAGFTKDDLEENIKLISEQRQKQINDIANYKENIKWYQFATRIKNSKDKKRRKELPPSKTEESISRDKNVISELHKMLNETEAKDETYTSKTSPSIDEVGILTKE